MTKHVKFAEDKTGYEWIYKGTTQAFKHNEVWSEDDQDSSTKEIKSVQESKSSNNRKKDSIEPSEKSGGKTEDVFEEEKIVAV